MADSFEKWMERQIKQNRKNGTAKNCEELNNVWATLQSEASKDYERRRLSDGSVTVGTRIENGERIRITTNKEATIDLFLSNRFFMEFLAIKKHFTEYYTLFGLFDRPYFKRLINDFRKHFTPDRRAPGIKYFDDLICDLITEIDGPGEAPLNFPDYLKNPELAPLIKDELKRCRTKDYAALFIALEKTSKIKYSKDSKAVYNAMIGYFGNFGNYPGFMEYLNPGTPKNLNLIGSKRIEFLSDWLNKQSEKLTKQRK